MEIIGRRYKRCTFSSFCVRFVTYRTVEEDFQFLVFLTGVLLKTSFSECGSSPTCSHFALFCFSRSVSCFLFLLSLTVITYVVPFVFLGPFSTSAFHPLQIPGIFIYENRLSQEAANIGEFREGSIMYI